MGNSPDEQTKELKVYVPQDGPYGLEPEEGGEPVEEETCYLKSEVDAERKRQRMYRERMKNEGKVRVLINGNRKWIDKNIAEKFKEEAK